MQIIRKAGQVAATLAATLMVAAVAVPAMAQLATPDVRRGDAGFAGSQLGAQLRVRTMYQNGALAEGMNTGIVRPAHTRVSAPPPAKHTRGVAVSANNVTLDKRAQKVYQ